MIKKNKKTTLTSQEIRELRGKLHHLKPVVIIGNKGLSETVIQEINRALNDHELIKIRIQAKDRKDLSKITNEICTQTNSTLINTIGHIASIYRKNLQKEEL